MSDKSETKHAVRMRKLLTVYSEQGRTISSLTKLMGRKTATLKKWAAKYSIPFRDHKRKERL